MECRIWFVLIIAIFFTATVVAVSSADGGSTAGSPDPGPDFEGALQNFMDDPLFVVAMDAPKYRWSAEQHMDLADQCAAKGREAYTKFINRGYTVYQDYGKTRGFTPLDKNTFASGLLTDPDATVLAQLISGDDKDPETIKYYKDFLRYGTCFQDNYNAAMSKLDKNDYTGKAEVWERAAITFHALGNERRAQECETQADKNRNAANTKSLFDTLFEPLPEWVAVAGILGGLFLIHYRKKKKE